jgi:hypothetical protein
MPPATRLASKRSSSASPDACVVLVLGGGDAGTAETAPTGKPVGGAWWGLRAATRAEAGTEASLCACDLVADGRTLCLFRGLTHPAAKLAVQPS